MSLPSTKRALARGLLTAAALGSATTGATAQQQPEDRRPAVLVGQVVSATTGAPVDGAVVTLLGSGYGALTDSTGNFRIPQTWAGVDTLEVRFISYEPSRTPVELAPNETTRVTLLLSERVVRVADLTVEVRRTRRARNLAGFVERMEKGFGDFFTPSDIRTRNPRLSSDLLRGLAGVYVGRIQHGKADVYLGDGRRLNCPPAVFLDGVYQAGMDLDDIPSTDLGAVEVYKRDSGTPIEFLRPGSTCGTIVIWTPDGPGFIDWAGHLPDPF